jgi:hypothetical protein
MLNSEPNIEKLIQEYSRLMADQMVEIAKWANTEEDVRHECNKLIDGFIERAGIKLKGRHEYYLAGGRLDSKYARVLLEYKYPKGPKRITEDINSPGAKEVIGQLKKRFQDFQAKEHVEPEKLFGVGTDGDTLLFVYTRGGRLEVEDPKPTTHYNVERILLALVSLGAQGKSYKPSALAVDFGAEAESPIAQKGIHELYEAITTTENPKALTFFNQWKILFGEVCGYSIDKPTDKIAKLAEHYDIPKATQPAELLFAVHSYYAIFIKLLATEIVAPFSPMRTSKIKKCVAAATSEALKREMEELERGGIWTQLGITNFLEGDLFSWYIAAWDDHVAEAVRRLAAALDEYDPTTLSVDRNESRDMLKKLYQHLFPKAVYKALGEYYTPDWLAEHVLNRLEYDGNPDKRLLDPACGSGTFLVMAINRIKAWFEEHRYECGFGEAELVQKILKNVIGFDLNPLAVMASRTNYLFAIRRLLNYATNVDLPVYLCDSIMTPAEAGSEKAQRTFLTETGVAYDSQNPPKAVKTTVGIFLLPAEIASNREFIGKYADILESCISEARRGYTTEEFLERCRQEGLPVAEEDLHRRLYEQLLKLDEEQRNDIWAKIIKNAFAPLFVERVDYVAGNPPWVNWENLPEDYRQSTAALWQVYDLFRHKGYKAKLGGGKDDISILMTYVAVDAYLKDKGSLGFLITQSVFKTKGGGEGFRTFQYKKQGKTLYLDVVHVDDMSDLKPFEAAANRTAVFVCRKSTKPFSFPVPYHVWKKARKTSLYSRIDSKVGYDGARKLFTFAPSEDLKEVLRSVDITELAAVPVDKSQPTSPWLTAPKAALAGLQRVIGQSDYQDYAGACTWLNGVYWIRILERLKDGKLLIENMHDVGKIKVDKVPPTAIEPDLVYPLLRGRDVKRWQAEPSAYIILANRTDKLGGIPEAEMKQKYPQTFAYFKKFEEQLRKRSGYRQFFKPTDPFWSMYNVGPYTMKPIRVFWRQFIPELRMTLIKPHKDEFLGVKLPLTQHVVTLATFDSEKEAFFFTACGNSSPATLLHWNSSTSKSYGQPHILEMITIPKFNPKDKLHQRLAELSEKAHKAAGEGDDDTVKALEAEIDEAAAGLWGITEPELKEIQKTLKQM